jgi:hypothetical protein
MAGRLRDAILSDTRANQPTATAVAIGTLYFVTDEDVLERSDGTDWAEVAINTTAHAAIDHTGITGVGGGGSATFVGTRAYNNAVQSLANNTATAVTFNTELYDTDSIHDTSSNTSHFTVPTGKGGKWRFSVNIAFAANGSGWRGIYLQKNGTTKIIGSAMRHTPTSGAATSCVTSVTVDLVATDYIEVFAIQTSGGALDIGHATATELQSAMEAVFLG